VPVKGDLLNEADETFVVDLSGAVNGTIVDSQGVGTITNDDPMPVIFALPAVSPEGSAHPRTAVVTVRLSAASGQQVTVTFRTADGTAVDGVGEASPDYTPGTGTIVFAPGQTQQTITIGLRNDLVVEPDEYFFVDLRTPQNALLATPRTVVLVLDDDAPARQLLVLGEQVTALHLDVLRTANLLGDLRLNCGHLQQFTRDIARYRGAQVRAIDADELIAGANRLRAAINCPV
jgi:hypothetical protein